MNGQNLTKFCIHIIDDKIYVGIVNRQFLQICNRVIALDWRFFQYLDTIFCIHIIIDKIYVGIVKDHCLQSCILRGTRNLSFVLSRSLLRTFETIWILVITQECIKITASKSIRRERKMRSMELSGVNFSTHGSESECSCFDQVLCIRL